MYEPPTTEQLYPRAEMESLDKYNIQCTPQMGHRGKSLVPPQLVIICMHGSTLSTNESRTHGPSSRIASVSSGLFERQV